eukprot:CAMPEP_0119547226 /NCGR_PEP_ID=MMETSP1352-20130426/1393_1 /TAXON_ID=265584 /ORGANISM="Stauroneis constricta, Strain CCMP1120" /LENGTH=327 /DNA_ID=CAMNT_0007592087 /DNA_START=297 /DNA_END=1280 /DNA_ORIENTATION=-
MSGVYCESARPAPYHALGGSHHSTISKSTNNDSSAHKRKIATGVAFVPQNAAPGRKLGWGNRKAGSDSRAIPTTKEHDNGHGGESSSAILHEDQCTNLAPTIVFLGAPASGKGTQCKLLAERFGMVHLSTGDMLRAAVDENTEDGLRAKEFMEKGQLVPDELVTRIVSNRLQDDDCRNRGFILDGYPRTKAQARSLRNLGVSIDATIVLDVPDSQLVERIVGRRLDPVTGKIYHLDYFPPPKEIVNRLEHRSDDRVENVAPRIRSYNSNVMTILREMQGTILRIDGTGDVAGVSAEVEKTLRSLHLLSMSSRNGSRPRPRRLLERAM